MSNNYNFKAIEEELLAQINLTEAYKSNPSSKQPPFATLMPPPNITGSLHIGHALVLTLQDILTRFHRMQGFDTLWQAGVDHAGIATQLVVEKNLAAKGIKKEDLGEDGFTEEVLKWKEEAENRIIAQIQKIGASCDFSNIAFTFSEEFSDAVNQVFVTLFEEGLIYQDYRLVNWDTKFATAISDLEVTNKEEEGSLYYIKYIINETESIIIATTRPETMFGDVAIAVNPSDIRYQHLVGKKAKVPIINKEIPIIFDDYSDKDKGTGAVKITPAHDFNDFEVGERHKLPLVIVIDQNGKLNNNVPKEFQGLSVKEARKKVLESLTALGALEKVEKHLMQIPYGDRSNTVIEPLPSKQWFLNVNSMAAEAIAAVKNKEVKLIPASWENLYFNWLNNIKPWCISRQLWWGHKIPVWHAKDGKAFAATSKEEALVKAKKHYGSTPFELTRDSSVLDTWFSSSLWPFVTLGWPNLVSERLQKYYPTSILVTGFDILFFWVARMIMMGKHFLKKVPFKAVYLHALILDEKGQKMSKTKGNVIDPLLLMEKYGTDAFRFTLANYASSGQNIKFAEKNLEGFRNFVTKIWNAYRFLQYHTCSVDNSYNPKIARADINKWILLELEELITNINKNLKNCQFSEATNKLYHFVWDVFCDWYIEIIKIIFTGSQFATIQAETKKTAAFVFNNLIALLHPITPFITQHLFNLINNSQNILLTKAMYPKQLLSTNEVDSFITAKDNLTLIMELINKVRSIRAYLKISPKVLITLYSCYNSIISSNTAIIEKLTRLTQIIFTNQEIGNSLFKEVISSNLIIGLDLKSVVDIVAEKQRLMAEKNKLITELTSINSKLSNNNFINKAPKDIVENVKKQQQELSLKLNTVNDIIIKLN